MYVCPHCGHEAESDVCPLCGTEMGAGTEGAGDRPAPPGRGAGVGRASPGGPPPFEDPAEGFLGGLWRSWKESLLRPSRFFSRVGDGGTILRPLLYYLIVTVVGAFFTLMWQSVWISLVQVEGYAEVGEAMAVGPVLSFFFSPFVALVVLVMGVLVYHLGALVLAPDRQGMAATARVVCYAAGPAVLAAVPVLGSLVAGVWTLVLQVVGLREAHRTTTGRALLMVFWPWLAFFALIVVAVLAALALSEGGGGGVPVAV